MKKTVYLFAAVGLLLSVSGCSGKSKGTPVAERVTDGEGNELVVIRDIKALKKSTDTVDLSDWCEKLEIVRLDNRPEALFTRGSVIFSENYIGLLSGDPVTFKLFDRKGNYLRDIGHQGRGPSEYNRISGAAIDEKNGRIYIVSWGGSSLLCFGIDGTIHPPIPFPVNEAGQPFGVYKGHVRPMPDGTFMVSGIPAPMNNRVWVWRQDGEGNLLQVLARMPEGQRVDFSSESGLSPDTKNYEPFLVVFGRNYNDTLSRFEPATERWAPRFTIDNLIETFQPPYYSYTELPNHFIGNFSPGITQVGENSFESNVPLNFFVDKKSLTGSYYNLKIGELGGLEVWPNFTDGYFVVNWPAITVRGQLKNLLDAGGMEAATAQRVQKLYDSLDDEDNNVLLTARLKR